MSNVCKRAKYSDLPGGGQVETGDEDPAHGPQADRQRDHGVAEPV